MFTGQAAPVNRAMGPLATIDQIVTMALLPPTCCLCGARGRDATLDLCDVCFAMLPRSQEDNAPASFAHALVPFRYDYPVNHFIRGLKFRGERVYARVLGTLLAEARTAIDLPLPQAVIPVPLHSSRYRERGFNQAHELALYAARRLRLQVDSRCLTRVLATQEQSGLPLSERAQNVQNAFRMNRPLRATRIALVDDVLTTGSTAAEAARVLTEAGATDIELWAAARVTRD